MGNKELLNALRHLSVQTGSLACLGCGFEHGCSVHGCAILRTTVDVLLNNPKNRKTKAGIKRFVNNWLSGDQNRARPDRSGGYSKPGKPPMGSGELGEAELEAIRQVMADGGGG